jgi:hypothetical protein
MSTPSTSAPPANPRHISDDQFSDFLGRSAFPDILQELREQALNGIGFFTKHATRAIEYPWAVHQLESRGVRSVVDVGAGVSVLPLRLASRGAKVVTVDYSRKIRTLQDKAAWTEWGFLDYALLEPSISSHNAPLSKVPLKPGSFDAFYCISVIEHTPRALRIDLLETAAKLVRSGGWAVVTLDLVPRTRRLWNRDRGRKAEEDDVHGTLDDFVEEAASAGWKLEVSDLAKGTPGAATDVAMLVFQRTDNALTIARQDSAGQPQRPATSLRERFAKIYQRGGWSAGKAGSASGAGSSLEYTTNLRKHLGKLLAELRVSTFLDAPCGDFAWFKEVEVPDGMLYLGMDIVRDLVRANQSRFGSRQRVFFAGDITVDPLPSAELMMCRDCLFHLPNRDCFAFFENFLASGIDSLLLTSHTNTANSDLPPSKGFRQVNFRLDPFRFPEPRLAIEDYMTGFPARHVCLWKADDIRRALGQVESLL